MTQQTPEQMVAELLPSIEMAIVTGINRWSGIFTVTGPVAGSAAVATKGNRCAAVWLKDMHVACCWEADTDTPAREQSVDSLAAGKAFTRSAVRAALGELDISVPRRAPLPGSREALRALPRMVRDLIAVQWPDREDPRSLIALVGPAQWQVLMTMHDWPGPADGSGSPVSFRGAMWVPVPRLLELDDEGRRICYFFPPGSVAIGFSSLTASHVRIEGDGLRAHLTMAQGGCAFDDTPVIAVPIGEDGN